MTGPLALNSIPFQPDAHLEDYLDHVCAPLVGIVPYPRRQELRAELRSHLEALASAYQESGSSPEVATLLALRQFGEPRAIARQWIREWCRERPAQPLPSPWRSVPVAVGCFGVATLLSLVLLYASRTEAGRTMPLLDGVAWLLVLYLLPAIAGLATGLLAPARHALGAFFAQALILPCLMLVYRLVNPTDEPYGPASSAVELAFIQSVLWVPIGSGLAALGGSLRRWLTPRPGRWVLQ